MEASHWIQVAAAIISHEGRYLITQRKHGAHLQGLWEFPGGKKEPDESLEQCVCREVWEELGLEVGQPELLQVCRFHYPDKQVELHFFSCVLKGGEAQPLGCAQFVWVRPEELLRYEFPPADLPVVQYLANLKPLDR